MPTFSEAVQESGRLALCALFAGNEAVNALLSPLTGDSLGLYPLTSGLRRKLCSDDPANDPVYVPPFEGGQCDAPYLVDFDIKAEDGGVIGGGPVLTNGPIAGVRSVPLNNATPPLNSLEVGSHGSLNFVGTCDTTSNTGFQWRQVSTVIGGSIELLSVTPCGANDCGDPPPPPAEPGPITTNPPDITYNIDGDTTITVPISFTFSPAYVALDGSINIPVNFDVGGVDFNGEVTVSPEFNFEFNPGGIDRGPGTVDDPDGIGSPGIPSVPPALPPENTLPIIGVLVYSDIDSDFGPSGIFFDAGPDIYVPRVASVKFAIRTADSIGWTADQDVKNLESYIPCPALQGAIAVRVQAAPGVTSRFTPVRGRLLTTDQP